MPFPMLSDTLAAEVDCMIGEIELRIRALHMEVASASRAQDEINRTIIARVDDNTQKLENLTTIVTKIIALLRHNDL